MVVRKDTNQMQKFSFVLHINGKEKTLELTTDFPDSSDSKGNQIVIKEVVKHVRQKNELKADDTLVVRVKSTHRKKVDESVQKYDSMHKIDMEAKRLNSATSGRGYHCKDCNLRYRHKHNFDLHLKTHESGNKATVQSELLSTNHEQLENKINLYCEKCNKYLKTSSGYSYHMRHFHNVVKKHACDICGRCFASNRYMTDHRRIHTGERPYICQMCGKTMRTSAILYRHLQSHSSERPYSCSTCQKTFKYSNKLADHSVVHTGEKNHICEFCGKRFAKRTCFSRHMKTHNGLKPYPCPICSSTFNQKRYLKQHLNGRHSLDPRETRTIVQNIAMQVTKQAVHSNHQQHFPVNETVDALNLLQNEEVSMNETDEALRRLESVEIHQTNLINPIGLSVSLGL